MNLVQVLDDVLPQNKRQERMEQEERRRMSIVEVNIFHILDVSRFEK